MTESAVGSHDYNLSLGRLRKLPLRQALTAADYERLKHDSSVHLTVVVDPVHATTARWAGQRAMLMGRIDQPTYTKLLGDLIRPDNDRASGNGDGGEKPLARRRFSRRTAAAPVLPRRHRDRPSAGQARQPSRHAPPL